MKKLITIFLSLLLVLLIGQAVFANDNFTSKVGYSTTLEGGRGLNVGISAGYELWGFVTLEGNFETDMLFGENTVMLAPISFGSRTKIDILDTDFFNFGLQVALEDTLILVNSTNERGGLNILSAGVGAYGSISPSPKFTIYTDMNIPFLHLISIIGDYRNPEEYNDGIGFALAFDVKFGVTYNINYHVSLGLEAGYDSLFGLLRVGANVGYTF